MVRIGLERLRKPRRGLRNEEEEAGSEGGSEHGMWKVKSGGEGGFL